MAPTRTRQRPLLARLGQVLLATALVAVGMVSLPAQPAAANGPDLALGKSATASSIYSAEYSADKAVDGDATTRWSSLARASTHPSEWWSVDLGSNQSFNRVTIAWESAYASDFTIAVSTDGTTFTPVQTVSNGTGGTTITDFATVTARHVKVTMSGYAKDRQNFSFFTFSVQPATGAEPEPAPTPEPRIVDTVHPSEDVVVATAVVTDEAYGADPTGVADATEAIRRAIDTVYSAGGGVVWMPAGKYRVTGSIHIKNHVTLRGDRRDPDVDTGGYGTVVLADVSPGGELDAGLFRIWGSAGVNGLTVYYPNQSATAPVAYPFTFEVLGRHLGEDGYMSGSVQNVTMLNSYRGISAGAHNTHELLYVRNAKGTVLHTGLYLQDSADVDKVERVKLSNAYWAALDPSLSSTRPMRAQLDAWTRVNGTGLKFGGLEWTQFTDLAFSDYAIGIDVVPGRRIGSMAMFSKLSIQGANIGMRLNYLDQRSGMLVNDAVIRADQGTTPIGIKVQDNSGSNVVVQSSTIGGDAAIPVQVTGNTMVNLQNTVFDSWSGTYAVDANAGSIVIEGSTFVPQLTATKKGVRLQAGVRSAALLGNTYTNGGGQYLLDNTSSAVIEQSDDAGLVFAKPATDEYLERPNRPGTTGKAFLNVLNPPYNALPNDDLDDTAAIQSALNAAGRRGGGGPNAGGTVYLPAGIYRVNSGLTVPAGVELRGADDVPHRAQINGGGISTGTIIYAYGGRATTAPDTAMPLITLNGTTTAGGAGVRGLSVHYPEQATDSASNIVAYPWTIRGNGPGGVYVMDVAFTNAYRGIDFATNTTDDHYVEQVVGTVLKEGIRVGNASRGWVQNNLFNITGWARTGGMPGSLEEVGTRTMWSVAAKYTKANLHAYVATAGAQDQWMRSNFVYAAATGFTVEEDAVVKGFNVAADQSATTLDVTGTGTADATFINMEGCGPGYGNAINVSGGTARVFNVTTMCRYSRAVAVTGGMATLSGAAFDLSTALVSGGTLTANGVLVADNAPHVTVHAGGTAQLVGNIGGGPAFVAIYAPGSAGTASRNIPR